MEPFLTTIGDGVKTVAAAGTAEALSASARRVQWLVIQAQSDNTNLVAIGASGVLATEATGDGILLEPGEKISLYSVDIADIFVDALVSGEGVRFFYGYAS